MKLYFMQVGRNLKTKENNENDGWDLIESKLNEEFSELMEAIEERNLLHIAEEVQDLIQVCIRVLALLKKKNINLEQVNRRHNQKLVKRMWTSVRTIRVFWDK